MGNATNLSVAILADITDLRAKMALAQIDLKQTTAALAAAAAEAKKSGLSWDEQARAVSGAAAAHTAAMAKVAGLKSQISEKTNALVAATTAENTAIGVEQKFVSVLGGVTKATNEAKDATHNHGAATEAMVLIHEAMSGRFTKMGGSLMILTQRLAGASLAMMGLAGAFAVAAMGAMHLIEYIDKVAVAKDMANSAGAAFNPVIPQSEIDLLRTQLVEISGVSTEMSGKVSGALLRVQGVGVETMKMLAAAAKPVASAMGEDITASAEKMATAMDKPTANGRAFLEGLRASDAQLAAFDAAVGDVNPLRERQIILERINEVTKAVTAASGTAAHAAEALRAGTAASLSAVSAGPMDQSISSTAEQLDRAAPAADRYAEALKGLTNEERLAGGGMNWLSQQRTALAEATLATVQAGRDQNQSWDQIARAKLVIERDFWKKAVDATRAGSKEQEEARRALYAAEEQLARSQSQAEGSWSLKLSVQAKEAGDAAVMAAYNSHQSRLKITEAGTKAEMEVYRAASADMTRTDAERLEAKRQFITLEMALVKEQAGGETVAAQKAYEAKIAAYDAEIANAHRNVQEIEALEAQKLAYIKSARGIESAEYQRALKEETAAVASAVTEQIKLLEQAGSRRIADQKEVLAAEAGSRQISRADELTQLQQFVQAQRDAELATVTDLIGHLQEGTAAYKAAIDARTALIENFGVRLKTLQAQIDTTTAASSNRMAESYISAFSQVGSSAQRAFTGFITNQSTALQAEQAVARSTMSAFVDLTTQMASRWLVTQLAMTSTSATQAAVRTAQDQSFNTSGFGALLAAWTAKEGTQTTITETHAATRATADSGGGFMAGISSMLSRWFGMETAKTATTTAQAGTRETTEAASATAGSAAIMLAARASIAAAAAVASAWAFADSAEAGPPGLAAAPEIASGAYGTVMAFQTMVPALATGTYDVPQDMLAQIHKGEMVVPAPFASAVRSGDVFNGGKSSSNTVHYAPTFHGGGSGMVQQARQEFEKLQSMLWNMNRNGNLALPGRG